ncbi:hypothetical protein [Mycobacterium sp.]|uniref:hypothetical protein n=1 Tax=Mycobacterium sp. TaxID=1785 RepID=UPI003C783ECF
MADNSDDGRMATLIVEAAGVVVSPGSSDDASESSGVDVVVDESDDVGLLEPSAEVDPVLALAVPVANSSAAPKPASTTASHSRRRCDATSPLPDEGRLNLSRSGGLARGFLRSEI